MATMKKTPLIWQALSALMIMALIASFPLPAAAQNCTAGLTNLRVCAPFVVPGASGAAQIPNVDCCNALRGVNHDCLCSTMNIINTLPSSCGISRVSCGA